MQYMKSKYYIHANDCKYLLQKYSMYFSSYLGSCKYIFFVSTRHNHITGGSTLKLLASYLRLLKSINKRRRSLKLQGLCPVSAKLIAKHHAHHGIRLADSRDAFAETLKCCLQANHWHPLATFVQYPCLVALTSLLHLWSNPWRLAVCPAAFHQSLWKAKTKWSNQHRKCTKISNAKNKMAPGHYSCMTR